MIAALLEPGAMFPVSNAIPLSDTIRCVLPSEFFHWTVLAVFAEAGLGANELEPLMPVIVIEFAEGPLGLGGEVGLE